MQRLLGFAREVAINFNEILRLGNFAGNNNLIAAQSALQRQLRGFDRREHHAIIDDLFGVETQIAVGIFLHLAHHQFLIERPAIDANAYRLAVVDGNVADRRELLVTPRARAHVSGIDAVFIERPRAIRIFCEQDVPVVMKIANDRRNTSGIAQPRNNFRHRRGRFRHVHRNAHQLRPGFGQFLTLRHGPGDISRIGVGHRLNNNRCAAAHLNVANLDANRLPPRDGEYLHRLNLRSS